MWAPTPANKQHKEPKVNMATKTPEFETLRRLQRKFREAKSLVEVQEYIANELARMSGGRAPHPREHTGHGWFVATQAKSGRTMFLIDRGRDATTWWTENFDDALEFSAEHVAEKKASTYRHNAPRVLTYAQARDAAAYNRQLAEVGA